MCNSAPMPKHRRDRTYICIIIGSNAFSGNKENSITHNLIWTIFLALLMQLSSASHFIICVTQSFRWRSTSVTGKTRYHFSNFLEQKWYTSKCLWLMGNSLRTIKNIGISIYNSHQIKLYKIEKLNLSSCILISLKKYHSNISQNVLLHARTYKKRFWRFGMCVFVCIYLSSSL